MPTCTEPSVLGAVDSFTGEEPPEAGPLPPSLTYIASTKPLAAAPTIGTIVEPFFSSVPRITAWFGALASALIDSGANALPAGPGGGLAGCEGLDGPPHAKVAASRMSSVWAPRSFPIRRA